MILVINLLVGVFCLATACAAYLHSTKQDDPNMAMLVYNNSLLWLVCSIGFLAIYKLIELESHLEEIKLLIGGN
jgi:hypothetical protein